jgi:hypothetical protein
VVGFAEAVNRLHTDRRFGAELGVNGRDYVSKHLTSEKIGEQMYEVFVSVAILKD